jgi:diamine N-acetyltransferase
MTADNTLVGELVALSGFLPQDKEILFSWINDPATVRFNSAFRPIAWDEHCAWWDALNTSLGKHSMAIRSVEDNRIVGTVQLVGIQPIHRHAEVSIRIGDQADRERGAGTEALRMLVRYGFHHLNLHRIFIHVWTDNARAIRAYEKAGFRREGVMRQHVFIDGAWKDVAIMAALRDAGE